MERPGIILKVLNNEDDQHAEARRAGRALVHGQSTPLDKRDRPLLRGSIKNTLSPTPIMHSVLSLQPVGAPFDRLDRASSEAGSGRLS